VGTREHDAWIIYYHAPVGTAVKYRYCIEVIDEEGKKVTLKDIYGYGNKKCRP
jgi:L,D-transpeptidase ErfK/SrfK